MFFSILASHFVVLQDCEGQHLNGHRLARVLRGRGILRVVDCLCLGVEYKSQTAGIQQRVARILKRQYASHNQVLARLISSANGRWANVRRAFPWHQSTYCLLESKLSFLIKTNTKSKWSFSLIPFYFVAWWSWDDTERNSSLLYYLPDS